MKLTNLFDTFAALVVLALVVCLMAVVSSAVNRWLFSTEQTYWTGNCLIVGVGPGTNVEMGFIPTDEIGFRSDGVLVWRKRK